MSNNGRGVKVRSVEQNSPATQFISDDRLEFARAVVQTILKAPAEVGNRGFEGCVFVWDTHREIEPGVPHQVWRYRDGRLRTATYQTQLDAFGKSRAKWPPHTFCFRVQSLDASQATVDILDFYNAGLADNSRGGNGSKWTLANQGGRWEIVHKQATLAWD